MSIKISLISVCILFLIPSFLVAQTEEVVSDETEIERLKYGVGFQGSFPASGISGMMNVTDDIAAQAIVGFFGNLRTFAGRGLYKFQEEDYWDLYGYGMAGAWSYRGFAVNNNRQTETVLGLGAGAGFQYDWRAYNSDFPPIAWNIELGIGFVDFKEVNYNFSTIMFGAGVHYRF